MQNFMGMDGFIWFVGVVEDREDPSQLGRVRVRCVGYHTDDKSKIPTADLPWAHVMHPVTDPSMSGMGNTPPFMVEGTHVVGFFMDADDKQQPVIIGTLPGVPEELGNPNKGFYDPNRRDTNPSRAGYNISVYPRETGESDVNRLARADKTNVHTMINSKIAFAESFKEIETAQSGNFEMPFENSLNNTRYPFNHVYESESGHVREYDDTYNEERIGEYHKDGTFYEVTAGGDKIVHVKGDNYEFVAGNTFINVKGDVNLTVNGNFETLVEGDYNIRAKNLNIEVEQDMDTVVLRDTTERYEGIFKTTGLGAVSQRYNTTFDAVYKGATTLTYGDKLDSSIKGKVTERYADTVNRRIDGIQTEIYGATVNLTTEGSFNIDSEISFNVNATTVDLDATTVDIDGTTISANSTTSNINASSTLNLIGTTTNIDASTTLSIDAPADGTNVATTSAGLPGHGTEPVSATGASVESPDTPESDLKITEIIDVRPELRVKRQSSDRTSEAGTGGYNPNPDFDYPIPAIPIRASEPERTTEIEAKGIPSEGKNTSQQRQAHKDVVTDTVSKFYPELKDTPEGNVQINEGNDPASFEHDETLPPVTADVNATSQNQYRSYLGVPTAGKKFGDLFDISEVTDEIREQYSNKYFPKEILYTADDQEVVRGVKQVGQVKQEGYRIKELRGLPRLKIKLNASVTLTGTNPKVLQIVERVAFDMGRQLTTNSAFRTKAVNDRCGGAKGSKHLLGLAMDVRTMEMTNDEKVEFVRLCASYGALAFGFYNRFIHFDIHSKRNWGTIPRRYIPVLRQFKLSPYIKG